jgi:hypothetical protein
MSFCGHALLELSPGYAVCALRLHALVKYMRDQNSSAFLHLNLVDFHSEIKQISSLDKFLFMRAASMVMVELSVHKNVRASRRFPAAVSSLNVSTTFLSSLKFEDSFFFIHYPGSYSIADASFEHNCASKT